MANVDFTVDSDLPAPVILAAAVDFSTRRPDLWPMIDRSVYEVHASGPGWAEVTEGSRFLGTIWAREHYDWSVPGVVQATAIASNVFRPGGTWRLAVRDVEGRTVVAVSSRRRATGLRGRILGALFTVAGRTILAGNFRRTLDILATGSVERAGEPVR